MSKTLNPEITSFAFHRPAFSISYKKSASDDQIDYLDGIYSTKHGAVYIYGQRNNRPMLNGELDKPFVSYSLTYCGRDYRCCYNDYPSDIAISRRAGKFAEQVARMAAKGLKTATVNAIITTAPEQ